VSIAEALEQVSGMEPEAINLSALGRQWGWSRKTTRNQFDRWRAEGLLPEAPPAGKRKAPAGKRKKPRIVQAALMLPPAPQLQMPQMSGEPPAPTEIKAITDALEPIERAAATLRKLSGRSADDGGDTRAEMPAEVSEAPRERTIALRATTFLAALSLASCSAYFSITGLTAIFAGASTAVMAMGVAFELGKLTAVATIGRRYGSRTLRLALIVLVAVLMALNSIGIYGFLSRAHIEHTLAGSVSVANRAADVDARLEAKQSDLDDIKARIAQLDQTRTVTTTAVTKGHAKTTKVGDQGPARASLVRERETAETTIAALRVEKAKVEGERKAVEADLGPVRYLATFIGSTDEQTMRWFILVVALLLDPAAVLLLLAATARRNLTMGQV
jgi:hypothetical protein